MGPKFYIQIVKTRQAFEQVINLFSQLCFPELKAPQKCHKAKQSPSTPENDAMLSINYTSVKKNKQLDGLPIKLYWKQLQGHLLGD